MEKLKSAINWFEIPVTNFARAVAFYSEIFDYEMPTREMGHVRMGFLQHEPGVGTGGAIVCGDGCIPSQGGAKLFLNAGADLTGVLNRIEPAGGTIILGKEQITPEIGYFAIFVDTEDNRIYLHSMN